MFRVSAPPVPSPVLEDDLQTLETKCNINEIVSRQSMSSMKLHFVENFRRFINFDIPPLTPADADYHEFEHDPRVPLLTLTESIMEDTQSHFGVMPGAIVLLRRLLENHANLVISVNNMHRILVTTLLLAAKFIEDVPAGNEFFANASGIPLKTLFDLELEFLALLNYNSFISADEISEVLLNWSYF